MLLTETFFLIIWNERQSAFRREHFEDLIRHGSAFISSYIFQWAKKAFKKCLANHSARFVKLILHRVREEEKQMYKQHANDTFLATALHCLRWKFLNFLTNIAFNKVITLNCEQFTIKYVRRVQFCNFCIYLKKEFGVCHHNLNDKLWRKKWNEMMQSQLLLKDIIVTETKHMT